MKEHPILFSGPTVRAILADAKTQTRRIVDPTAEPGSRLVTVGKGRGTRVFDVERHAPKLLARCPYGGVGDRLWVRETWRGDNEDGYHYRADLDEQEAPGQWRPSIYMPRAASRIDLEIEAVRVERLQDITKADIAAEGVSLRTALDMMTAMRARTSEAPVTLRDAWRLGWDAINWKRASWASNPWVWVITFRRMRP